MKMRSKQLAGGEEGVEGKVMSTFDIYRVIREIVREELSNEGNKKSKAVTEPEAGHCLTVEEAAQVLNIKVSRLRTAIFRKEIPYIKIGSLVRIPRQALYEHLKRSVLLPKSPLEL